MQCVRVEPEPKLTSSQLSEAANSLQRLSASAFFSGLVRDGLIFAQIRLQLLRIEAGIPLGESGWLCLADIFSERWVEIETKRGLYEEYRQRVIEACCKLMGEETRDFWTEKSFEDEFFRSQHPEEVAEEQQDSLF